MRIKLGVQLNGAIVSNYSVTGPTTEELNANKGFATITFKLSDISLYDNIKVTYGSNGAGVPMTQWIGASAGSPTTYIEPINTILKNVLIAGTGGELSFQSTTVNFGTAWDSTRQYTEGAIVRYPDINGARYSAISHSVTTINPITGIQETTFVSTTTIGSFEADEWELADINVVVSGTLYAPVWDNKTPYSSGTVVEYLNNWYSANLDIDVIIDVNGNPIANTWNSADWTLVQKASISGYTGTTTTYGLLSSNNSSTITLSGVTTTSGRTEGLVFTLVASSAVQRVPYVLKGFLGDDNYSSITIIDVQSGYFIGSSSVKLNVNDTITITGKIIQQYKTDGSPETMCTIPGYNSPGKYYIAETDGYSRFKLTSYYGGIPDVNVTDGLTDGLTFSIENNLVVEINGVRVDGPSPTQTYRKIIQVGKDELKLSYPAPVYGISEFDINYFTVLINGSDIPQVNPADTSQVYWNVNYDFTNGKFYQMDADFINKVFNTTVTDAELASGAWGFFDDGTPFDNQSSFNVVLNPKYITLKNNDIVTLSYQVPGQVPPDTFTVEVDDDKLGGTLNVITSAIPNLESKVAITTFGRTTGQSLVTQRVTDATINLIPRLSTLIDTVTNTRIPGIKFSLTNPPLVTLDTVHSLTNKSPLQQVMIHGTSVRSLDGRRFYVSSTNYADMTTVQDSSKQVYLYNVDNPGDTSLSNRWDTSSSDPFTTLTGSSYIQLLNAANTSDSTLSVNPLVITQPSGYKLTDVSRLYVSIIYSPNAPGAYIGRREYVPTELLSFTQYGDVSTLLIQKAVAPGDQVLITSMVPTISPGEDKFRINNTWNTVSGIPNTPKLYRENQFTRTYVTEVINDINTGELTSFRVNNPQALVKTAIFSGSDPVLGARDVVVDPVSGIYYCLVDNVNNRQVSDIKITTVAGVAITGFESVATSNTTTVKIIFSSNPGVTKVNVTISAGNTLIINGEQLQFSSIVLDYSNPSYGLLSGFKRGLNSTGEKEIKLYDIVQSVLDENVSDDGNSYKNWYSNNIDTEILTASANGTYTFTYPTGVNADGSTASDIISSVSNNDTIAFKVGKTYANGIKYTDYVSEAITTDVIYTNASTAEYVYATYASTGGSATTMTMVSTAGITKGMYVNGKGIATGTTVVQIFGQVITLSAPVTSPEGEYSFYNIPTANVFNFNIDDDNIRKIAIGSTVTFTHNNANVVITTIEADGQPKYQNSFTVTNSYANTLGGEITVADATIWTIETAESPAVRVGDKITVEYHDFDVTDSYQSGNTWIIKTAETPTLLANTSTYVTYNLDLPLQLDGNSIIADFLNKQIR
jgi:hypothetical protein